MKKRLYILLCLCLAYGAAVAGIHTYTGQSVLSQGKWVKISVPGSGVCRMSFSELQAAGLNPQQLRVYGYGGAMLTQDFSKKKIDDLPQVPVYIGADYVLFWVQGPISWSHNGTRYVHTRNPYSDTGCYFLTDNVGSLLAPVAAEAVSGEAEEITEYLNLQVHELDSLNLINRANGLAGGGREFYGEQFSPGYSRSFSFSTLDAIETENATAYIDLAAFSKVANSTFTASFNGVAAQTSSIPFVSPSYHYGYGERGFVTATSPAKSAQKVQLSFKNSSADGIGWLNYIELITPCKLRMSGDWIVIRDGKTSSTPFSYSLANAGSNVQIWDITDLSAIRRMPTSQGDSYLRWTGSSADGPHTYVAVNTQGSNFVKATVVGDVGNQNLHKLRNIDYVIICPEGYEAASRQLAQAHEKKQSITWAVVTDKQVYNEFSSGTPDASAYRWLMKMLYDRGNESGTKPRWLLLMGDGTFDNRKLLALSGQNTLLTYQAANSTDEVEAYASDDYFGWLDDNEGTQDEKALMDIGVGRLPVNTPEEAQQVVNKLVRYMENTQHGKWKQQILYLADDGDSGGHTITAEGSAERLRLKNLDFIVNKVYLDAYPQEVNASGESYPLAKNRVTNLLRNGVLYFNYSGHGGYNSITNESVLDIKDIEKMSNQNLAFWMFATCNFAQFDAGQRSAAEEAVLNPNGGAVGVLSADRTVYATHNTEINRNFSDTLFGHKNLYHYDMTLGEATAIGKNRTRNDEGNKLAYVLLGDPAIRLNYPTDYQVETVTKIDTLNALSIQQVEGRIIDEDKQLVADFNGKMEFTVYDKMQVITTRDNDAEEGKEQVLSYNDYPNILFSGKTDVKDGTFRFTFMTPKDIRYNYGKGRIVYYAHDDTYNEDAVGHYHELVIGGTGSVVQNDTTGPEMTIYLNSPAFIDGSKTYATPRFFAELYDQHGINTVGSGIGHDLLLIVDDNPNTTYSLNEYFTAEKDSYQAGQVNYLLTQLADGPHRLTFRAWDLMNNSTTKSLNFIVESGLDPTIYKVTSYPNPVQQSGVMNLAVLYDQPDELLTTEVYLYNLSGQMIWSHTQNNPDQVQINLAELGMQPGVYMYNVRIKSATSKYSTCSGKIIVTK